MNNLKYIGLAMHNYLDANSHFPPAASVDKAGKPLLSWRVMILPYIDQDQLYKQFHLDEPWDSEHNKKLIDKMPQIYASPLREKIPLVRRRTWFPPDRKRSFATRRGLQSIR